MTIEKEAREIIKPYYEDPYKVEWAKLVDDIAKALQAKQDRIEELERRTKQCDACLKWNMPDSAHTCRKHDLVKRVEELESALKEIAKDEFLSEDCLHPKLAKKAIGGGK